MAQDLQNELVNFMFRRKPGGSLDVIECLKLWFGKGIETDIDIETRFGEHVSLALKGDYDEWEKTPRGCLALMILVDQFPRNIYRHTIQMYDGDRRARMLVDTGHDWIKVLQPEECLFVPCLILTHQENLADQRYCLDFYDKLEPLLPPELHVFRSIFAEHHRIVKLCGNFPHRDHYYGRTPSSVGQMILDDPKVRFDLPLMVDSGTVKFGHEPTKLWRATQLAFDVLERIDVLANEQLRRRKTVLTPDWLTSKEAAECHEVFRKFDKDGNGFCDREEMAEVLASTGRSYTTDQIQFAMDRITGIMGAPGLTFEQFADLLRPNMNKEDTVRRRFELINRSGSGEISLDELKSSIQGLDSLVSTNEVEEMLKKCDKDGNGTISYEEFMGMINCFSTGRMPATNAGAVPTGIVRQFEMLSEQVLQLQMSLKGMQAQH